MDKTPATIFLTTSVATVETMVHGVQAPQRPMEAIVGNKKAGISSLPVARPARTVNSKHSLETVFIYCQSKSVTVTEIDK